MPTYDYRCTKCGHRFELFHSIKDDAPKKCPRCKARAVRVPSGGAGILFKGSGFYITDYRSSSYKEKAKQETGKSEGSGKSDASAGGSTSGGDKSSGGSKSGGSKGGSKGGASATGS
jgi:putative FmdB family regulatory protein